jgi:5-formyltetrahydrofolate cyclo-ligase
MSQPAAKSTLKAVLRNQLRQRRQVIPPDLASTTRWKAINLLRTLIADLAPTVVALYSPIEHEIDLTPLAAELWRDQQLVALPRVVQRQHPLVFNLWPPHGALEPDNVGIPAATGPEIVPSLIVIPMLGYTRSGLRLGYGGGYYDRTLKALKQPVITVGVCYTELEITDYPAERHDHPLDFIVTGKELIASRQLSAFQK